MKKKMLVLGIAIVYSISAVGVPLHYHYCKGDLEHITLLFQKECSDHEEESKRIADSPFACCLKGKTSCESALNESGDCCDDETELLQIDENAVQAIVEAKVLLAATTQPQFSYTVVSEQEKVIVPCAHSPPDPGPPLYLLHSSLVFYG